MRRIFFCWQTDVDNVKAFIARCLKSAIDDVNKDLPLDLQFTYDEASRGVEGSPSLDAVIMDKIMNSEIVIADVTPITRIKRKGKETKDIPNPNVVLEAGYAAATKTWARTILIWNHDVTKSSSFFPFDIRNRLMAPFRLADPKGLTRALTDEIRRRAVGTGDSVRRTWLSERASEFPYPVQFYCLAHGSTVKQSPSTLRKIAWDVQLDPLGTGGWKIGLDSDTRTRGTWISSHVYLNQAKTESSIFCIREDGSLALFEPYIEAQSGRHGMAAEVRCSRFAGFLAYASVYLRRLGLNEGVDVEIGSTYGNLRYTPFLIWSNLHNGFTETSSGESSSTVVWNKRISDLPDDIENIVYESVDALYRLYSFDAFRREVVSKEVSRAVAHARNPNGR